MNPCSYPPKEPGVSNEEYYPFPTCDLNLSIFNILHIKSIIPAIMKSVVLIILLHFYFRITGPIPSKFLNVYDFVMKMYLSANHSSAFLPRRAVIG